MTRNYFRVRNKTETKQCKSFNLIEHKDMTFDMFKNNHALGVK
jgi:hypothetical protein